MPSLLSTPVELNTSLSPSSKGGGISKNSLSWRQHTTVLPNSLLSLRSSLRVAQFYRICPQGRWGGIWGNNPSSFCFSSPQNCQSFSISSVPEPMVPLSISFVLEGVTQIQIVLLEERDTGRLRAVDDANDESDRRWSWRRKKRAENGDRNVFF